MVWVRSPVYFYKRKNTYYFSKAVPSDLQHRFNKRKIEVSLRTKSEAKAAKSATALSDRLERHWDTLRMEMIYSRELGLVVKGGNHEPRRSTLTLAEALALYQRLKGTNKTKLFFEASDRSIRYLADCLGHEQLDEITSKDAGRFRDYLFDRGMSSSSINRIFSTVRAVINLSIKEHGLDWSNVFSGTYIPDDSRSAKRAPVPSDQLRIIQKECFELDDEARWLVAMISDTGMRLSEATGLLSSDIKLDCDLPHIQLVPHPWRRLKTPSSIRQIPLVGASFWAAQRIKASGQKFAFPKYCSEQRCNSNSASAALNKWLKLQIGKKFVVHSFRHSFRDGLRSVNCPVEIIDSLGGWSLKGIGANYGSGYSLDVKLKWMEQMSKSRLLKKQNA